MKIIGSIQARMGASRLPGKVLKEICKKPILLWHIERIKRSRLLDDIVVATTTNPDDDKIVSFCKKQNIKYFRGSEDDVLSRIANLIREFNIDIHVEFFGDSPLTDPHIIDEVVGFFLKNNDKYDYVSNSMKTTYPPGQEVAAFRGTALLEIDEFIKKDDPLREHVSIHFKQNRDKFNVFNLEAPAYYHYPEVYLEVDTQEDLKMISKIITHFTNSDYEHFSLAQILDYLSQNPEVVKINRHIERRWKEFREDNV